ncbi:Ankyrin repeat domain-containing protein 17, partial [Geodia barretti]
MLKYRGSLTTFEKSTTVDIYLCAISARPGGEISLAFARMTVKLNKPPSECSLYEIRELKESIEEKASLESYAMYIEAPGLGSVCARLRFPKEVGWMVGVVLTPDFKQENRVTEVSVKDWPWLCDEGIDTYLNKELRSASRRGDVEAVFSLITAGAVVTDVSRGGSSALMEAAKKGEPKVVSLLLEAGANIDLQNKDGSSALMEAARLGKIEAVSLLIKAGAALDLQNMQGDSAVILATANYHLPVLKELVRAGADLNLQNEDGLTALMISSRFGKTDLTETLVSGANISLDIQTTNNGWSALFFAVDKGHVAITKLLLKKGADPHLSDHSKLTIMDVATAGCHECVQELLRKFIANPSSIDTLEDSPADSTQDSQPPPYIESLQKAPEYTESQESPQSAESYYEPPQSSQRPPQSAESSWEPPLLADSSKNPPQSSQEPPQSVDLLQGPPQLVDSSQGAPESLYSSQEPPESAESTQEPPQSAESTQE